MNVAARPTGEKGMVDLYVDGKKVPGVMCKAGSARISEGLIEFNAIIRCKPFKEIKKIAQKEENHEDNSKH